MFVFSLSLSLPYLITHHLILFIFLINTIQLSILLRILRFSSTSMQSIDMSASSSYSTLERSRNTNKVSRSRPILSRSVQSSINLRTIHLHSSIQQKLSQANHAVIRIESALLSSDYSHAHISQSIMGRTNDLINRIGAGDELFPPDCLAKQQSTMTIPHDNNSQYLTLEHVPTSTRSKNQLTAKQTVLLSLTVFLLAILLCVSIIFFLV